MNLSISGHHLVVTPAIREYVMNKIERVLRHFDHVIDIQVILSVEKLKHLAEVTVHLKGKDIHCEAQEDNLYAAIDTLVDKVDRQVIKYKDKIQTTRVTIDEAPKRQIPADL
ncbi:ribosome hibernation-promoting factor, HPF/YfiA family [Pigmentiphaga litoralis]|jgi:putative sigma-54 modulation protein|uniref:Ribosome hibernation promoting factor n=1 Tax=Pigmentiphaga litoralis TaxID=516702 RepID=A0A7Y9IT24_9BURK|nr:ribosome-associated translation inhibitor RaiA [Pigmentiphaga litoralis]NYE24373.1 putative sigma-54 modulation protein [Pigmentiphaga litoralis]NYE82013.1 putative sigma-54 modulation protein [Pigmentiphaga litoralis]GGX17388.1 ribosomal subunit interface protein [Pigmentiphaga litoralis]